MDYPLKKIARSASSSPTIQGSGLGTMLGGPMGAAAGGAVGKNNPFTKSDQAAKDAAKKSQANSDALLGKTQGINAGLGNADQGYLNSYSNAAENYKARAGADVNKHIGNITELNNQARDQSTNAQATYTNTIQPHLKSILDDSARESSHAMTLDEAGDPNNKIQKSVRDLYNQQGQQARQQGQQDFGVLSALGAQAAGQQFGAAGPMTAGMQGQIYAQNQNQAGDAYARAQQRMHALQQQGLDKGFSESAAQYDRGQGAKDRYSNSVKDVGGAESEYLGKQAKLRDEQSGYVGDIFGTNVGYHSDLLNIDREQAGLGRDAAYAGGTRDLGAWGQYYGGNQQATNNEAASKQANAAGQAQFLSSLIGAGAQAGAAASDKRGKKGIANIDDHEIDEFLHAIKPQSYSYKEPEKSGTAGGKRVGFMLQDVQGTEIGDAITRKDEKGRMYYDKDNLDGVILAALSRQAKKGRAA